MESQFRRECLIHSDTINKTNYQVYIIYLSDTPICIEIDIEGQRVSCKFLECIMYFLCVIREQELNSFYQCTKYSIRCIYDNESLYLKNFNDNCFEKTIIKIPIDWDNFDKLIKYCQRITQYEKKFFSFQKTDK